MTDEEITQRATAFNNSITRGALTREKVLATIDRWLSIEMITPAEHEKLFALITR